LNISLSNTYFELFFIDSSNTLSCSFKTALSLKKLDAATDSTSNAFALAEANLSIA